MWLIDADDFNKDITEYFCWKKKMFNPPTEWQEGYLYAIDEFQRNLENRKTVKAIPIEWLVKHSEFGVIDRWIMAREKENEID